MQNRTADLYTDFLSSADTLRVYAGDMPVFASREEGLLPLIDYLSAHGAVCQTVVIYDKVMGNAAALLAVLANAREVFSPLGSENAVKTLKQHGIKYHLDEIVPCIMRDDGKGICPMEKLSLSKSPKKFYSVMKGRLANKA
jgi:hypothetical protein